jgi:hypothetical protein
MAIASPASASYILPFLMRRGQMPKSMLSLLSNKLAKSQQTLGILTSERTLFQSHDHNFKNLIASSRATWAACRWIGT